MRLSLLAMLNGVASTALLSYGLLAPVQPKARATQDFESRITNDDLVTLGGALFSDKTLSDPKGMACISCHDPASGFSYPESNVNEAMGPVEGVVKGRFGFRKVPSMAYSAFIPTGIPYFVEDLQAYVGGLFFDGRATDTIAQAKQPFLNPNEMNNLVHNMGNPAQVVRKIKTGPSGDLFRKVYGQHVFNKPVDAVYDLAARAIAAYERSPKVAQFTSKYDFYLRGEVQLTDLELRGLRLFTGSMSGRPGGLPAPHNAHCADCHGIPQFAGDPANPDIWTNSCYANLGVPKNPNNPFYSMTDRRSNPAGYNPLGADFIDYGLGGFMYPYLGKPAADLQEGDPLAIDGTFKTPTLRNVDRRPYPGFVKAYMHNGVFKSIEQVVHFYNTRNLTTFPGENIDFTRPDPYAGLIGTPLWGKPEWPSPLTMINPSGGIVMSGQNSDGGQIGNMKMTQHDEDSIVAFLKTLTDGYRPLKAAPPVP